MTLYEDPPKRLAIIGTRRFADPDAERRARAIIRMAVGPLCHGDMVVSGGAKSGVDAWAEEISAELGKEIRIYLPEHPRWEPDGYKARNILIARDCTGLLAIRCAHATSYGSGWTADFAEQLGKPVTRWILAADGDKVTRAQ